mmetsp:Transcript_119941/g.372888  ORF Transcript_119941/g.372888 Transcript_119941/m.372888 type:complete len:259 (+) Transcript_119941:2-778(+)
MHEAPSRPKRRGAPPAASRTSACTAGTRLPPPTSSTASRLPSGAVANASASSSFSCRSCPAAAASKASRVKGTEMSISGPSGPSGMKASRAISASGSMLSCFRQCTASLASRRPALLRICTVHLCFCSTRVRASRSSASTRPWTPSASLLRRKRNSAAGSASAVEPSSAFGRAKRTTAMVPWERPTSTKPTVRSDVPSGRRAWPWLCAKAAARASEWRSRLAAPRPAMLRASRTAATSASARKSCTATQSSCGGAAPA